MEDSLVDNLAQIVGRKLGRKVVVHRSQQNFRKPGYQGRMVLTKAPIKYSIGIEGCNPPVFFNLTVNEAKSRLAMLSDMLSSGVISATSPDARSVAQPSSAPQAGADVEHLPPNPDDRY